MEVPGEPEQLLGRARELKRQGFTWGHAWGKAILEQRIENWPSGWGDDLQILIYGDFQPPNGDLDFPELEITVHAEKIEGTVIRSALCVLKATVRISEKSVPALLDAARRINILLGSWTLVEWGNAGCGWWSHVMHGTGAGVGTTFDHKDLRRAIEGVLGHSGPLREKLDAALYWVREPRNLLMEFYRGDLLRRYSAYWNAFECLVDAVLIARPQQKVSRSDKQVLVDEFLAQRSGKLTAADVVECYHEIVNPGLVGRASHALKVCFPDDAPDYINECFRIEPPRDRLYNIRNSINHGDIDAENPKELLRVDDRLLRLWMIVWRMFGLFVPFSVPAERPPEDKGVPLSDE